MVDEDFKIVKQFSLGQFAQGEKQFFCTISRRETTSTETGIAWEVLTQTGTDRPVVVSYDTYAVAEMDFKNYVVTALSSDHFYEYSAIK